MAGVARILSIDGGGIRGIIPALILDWIERRTQKRISELFHMVAGTSTGGILACALVAPVKEGRPRSAAEIADLYRKRGQEIFQSSFWHGFGSIGGMVDEKYDVRNLESILEEYLAETKLSDIREDLLVTAYNLKSRQPFFFKSWKARGERLREGETAQGRDFLLRRVARATSAAPTYFEPSYVKNGEGGTFPLIDGGVFANNPAMCALSSARLLYPNRSRYLVVSIGTGETRREIPYEKAKDWGLIGWARPLLYIIFDGVSDTVDYQLSQEFRSRDYFRFEIELGAGSWDEEAPNDDMDDARPENIKRLEALAQRLITKEKPSLERLARQLSRPMAARENLVRG
ncbi:MAG: patatin-like phospholipase family protein [Proteobacteria bacterium]|nr:patatin-like phospholipase family protein [Pseudomonadota bacterium]